MEKLKPCPFCGGDAKTIVDYDTVSRDKVLMSAYVQCTVCGIYQRIKFDATRRQFSDFTDAFDRAISLWNQRA